MPSPGPRGGYAAAGIPRCSGGAVAGVLEPHISRAQQLTMPVVGFLGAVSPDGFGERMRGFRQGLKEAGLSEGENVLIDYRWARTSLIDCLGSPLIWFGNESQSSWQRAVRLRSSRPRRHCDHTDCFHHPRRSCDVRSCGEPLSTGR